MPISDGYDVVTVPFPYVERNAEKRRPALLVSRGAFQADHGRAWVVMITSAANAPWPGDIPIDDLASAGLKTGSVIRTAKIATVEAARLTRIGAIGPELGHRLRSALARTLGFELTA